MPYHGLARRKLTIVNNEERDPGNKSEARWTGEVRFVPEHLEDPLRWKKPRRIFVNSMSDLFHEKLPDADIDKVFGVMALAPQHIFQILTKRAARMRAYLSDDNVWPRIEVAARKILYDRQKIRIGGKVLIGPLPHIWLGVSVENQDAADERIPKLLATPAAVRFLSVEPLLGPIDFGVQTPVMRWLRPDSLGVRWVIVGCESGHGARPCDVEWIRSIRDQCAKAGVPIFLKQAEESTDLEPDRLLDIGDDDSIAFGDGSKLKGRGPGGCRIVELPYLDGVQHAHFPVVP